MHPYEHAQVSAKRYGGKWEDYIKIHSWFDASKEHYANFRHRALRHHAEGIFECEREFGTVMTNSDGKTVPVRSIGEDHVREDLRWIPTVKDWLSLIQPADWMLRNVSSTEKELEKLNRQSDNTQEQNQAHRPTT